MVKHSLKLRRLTALAFPLLLLPLAAFSVLQKKPLKQTLLSSTLSRAILKKKAG